MIRSIILAFAVAMVASPGVAQSATPQNPGITGACANVDIMRDASGVLPPMSFMQRYCRDTYFGWQAGYNSPVLSYDEYRELVRSTPSCVHAYRDNYIRGCSISSAASRNGRVARYLSAYD